MAGVTATTATTVQVFTDGVNDPSALSVRGNKQSLLCSGRGTCDGPTAQCKCFRGFAHSDGQNGPGTKADCGHNIYDILQQT